MNRLTDIGFLKIGYWFLEKNELKNNLTSFNSEKNIQACLVLINH